MSTDTFFSLLDERCNEATGSPWLSDLIGDKRRNWSYQEGFADIKAIASWLESHLESSGNCVGLLSKNRAHWVMADIAIMGSGNVTVPLFTTMQADLLDYIRDFVDMKLLIVGESMNWEAVQHVFPEDLTIIALPGVDPGRDHLKWEDLLAECAGREPLHQIDPDALATIVFTSGTTGKPKGVMQSQASLITPMQRVIPLMDTTRLFSYLPLAHIAERDIVETSSVMRNSTIHFNESMEFLARDLQAVRPTYLFGPPRVWEQMQQAILARFDGSDAAFQEAVQAGGEDFNAGIRHSLGLDQADYLLSAAAPVSPALLEWFHALGLKVIEGFGQSEVMGVAFAMQDDFKIGSIGRAMEGVDVAVSDEGEMLVKAAGPALGYYLRPEDTAKTFRDGWIHTGDKIRIDDDGFIFIIGRVNDEFKTNRGKFVSPGPIEHRFVEAPECEQVCLLGRGYHKPIMVCVLSAEGNMRSGTELVAALSDRIDSINAALESHERIGGVIISAEPWSIENGVLTHTMKIKRAEVEAIFGEKAAEISLAAAQSGSLKFLKQAAGSFVEIAAS